MEISALKSYSVAAMSCALLLGVRKLWCVSDDNLLHCCWFTFQKQRISLTFQSKCQGGKQPVWELLFLSGNLKVVTAVRRICMCKVGLVVLSELLGLWWKTWSISFCSQRIVRIIGVMVAFASPLNVSAAYQIFFEHSALHDFQFVLASCFLRCFPVREF